MQYSGWNTLLHLVNKSDCVIACYKTGVVIIVLVSDLLINVPCVPLMFCLRFLSDLRKYMKVLWTLVDASQLTLAGQWKWHIKCAVFADHSLACLWTEKH